MRIKSLLLLFSFILILAGCGSKSGLSQNDIGIRKIDDPKAKVVYGMGRADAEKVLGKGEKRSSGDRYDYDNGVLAYYREDKVIGVALDEESEGIYETMSGARIGMLEGELKKIYGDKYNSEPSDGVFLNYTYDSENKIYLNRGDKSKKSPEELKEVYVLTMEFDTNGYSKSIVLLDQLMAQLGR